MLEYFEDPQPSFRLEDPVLLYHILFIACDVSRQYQKPLQLHTGFGDTIFLCHMLIRPF